MMKSMTAYAGTEKTKDKLSVSVEVRTYNSKNLDIALRLPYRYSQLEEKIRSVVSEKISRGRIEIHTKIFDRSEDIYEYEINEPKAKAYYQAIANLKENLGLESKIPLELFASEGEIIKKVDSKKDVDGYWTIIRECICEALDNITSMREEEGRHIERDFVERLEFIEKKLMFIENKANVLVSLYQEKLMDRISALTKGLVEIDQGRIAQEAAFLADKSDISEEIVRAKSHITQFRTTMGLNEPCGRKLNFLLQEFNREFNTIGSKAGNAEISHSIVDLKSELEKIREQVQNVE